MQGRLHTLEHHSTHCQFYQRYKKFIDEQVVEQRGEDGSLFHSLVDIEGT